MKVKTNIFALAMAAKSNFAHVRLGRECGAKHELAIILLQPRPPFCDHGAAESDLVCVILAVCPKSCGRHRNPTKGARPAAAETPLLQRNTHAHATRACTHQQTRRRQCCTAITLGRHATLPPIQLPTMCSVGTHLGVYAWGLWRRAAGEADASARTRAPDCVSRQDRP